MGTFAMSADKAYLKPIGKRLTAVRDERGFRNREQFAEAFGVPKKTFEKYEQGLTELPTKLMMWLRDEHRVNLTWLVTGEGDMFDDRSKVPSTLITVEPATVQQLADTVGTLSQSLDDMVQRLEPPPPPPVTIKYYTVQASAGGGAAVLYESQGVDLDMQSLAIELLHIKPKHAGLLRVKGDSMLDTLAEGDLAVMDRSDKDPEEGGLYVVSLEGDVFVKRARWVGLAHLQWCSDNPAYDPIEVKNGDLNQMNVIGRVVWVWHNVR